MERYYKNKKRRSGYKRYCGCGQLLSRYNDNEECFPCVQKHKDEDNSNILEVINNVAKKVNKAKR